MTTTVNSKLHAAPAHFALSRDLTNSTELSAASKDSEHTVEELESTLNQPLCLWVRDEPERQAENAHIDETNYALSWFHHNMARERGMILNSMCFMNSPWEQLRLRAIASYWRTCLTHRISPVTIHLAIWILNRVLSEKRPALLTRNWFAGVILTSLRLALKFEERPETLWTIGQLWDIFPIFDAWTIERCEKSLRVLEHETLQILNDMIDVPLTVQYFRHFVRVGGWPQSLVKEYTSLGHYLLALGTFASSERSCLMQYTPSVIAAAATVLSVKIVNGDRRMRSFEFLPERLFQYCGFQLKELQPVIRIISSLLRHKPHDSAILAQIYPDWGMHDWK